MATWRWRGFPRDFVLPLDGVRVVEFSHMVMGPASGLVLADLGAEVIKVEPLEGDNTRRLHAAGAGFFPVFNRNKKSLAVDLKHPEGKAIVLKLLDTADVMTENFRPGALDKLGFGHEALSKRNPRLVYCSLKGFLDGPYDHRASLDEVVQMMGGLAYMTGLPDRPLRAGSSVVDIMGGTFAAVGILAALRERESTGRGKRVTSALFESTALLVAQHMTQYEITGEAPPPMSVKRPAWGVYDIFETAGDGRLFVGIVTDTQWEIFCREFGEKELEADARLKTNAQRVKEREWLIPRLGELFKAWEQGKLEKRLEAIGLPYAPIAKPWDLLDDPHLKASGGLFDTKLPNGKTIRIPALPLAFDGKRLPKRNDPPAIGEGSRELLAALGCSKDEIAGLVTRRVVAFPANEGGGKP
jgi:crotonobetainyl-CoA:carnitine CoA-transferase CaiB-like acyl-CoA transferase